MSGWWCGTGRAPQTPSHLFCCRGSPGGIYPESHGFAPLMLLVCFKPEGADDEATSRATVLQGSQCPLRGQPLGWVTAHEIRVS